MLTITHCWECEVCGRDWVQQWVREDGNWAPTHCQGLPPDWHLVNGELTCDKHRIVVDPDGEIAELVTRAEAAVERGEIKRREVVRPEYPDPIIPLIY